MLSCAQSQGQRVDEGARDRAVAIERGVEDRNVDAHHAPARDRRAEDSHEIAPRQAAGHPIIDRRHHRIIQDVGVEVDPESPQVGRRQVTDRAGSSGPDAEIANRGQIDQDNPRVFDTLAAMLVGLLPVAPAEGDDVRITQ